LPPISRHWQSTGDVRATQRTARKSLDHATCAQRPQKPASPTPSLLHLGLTARTHAIDQFTQNFPDQLQQFFIDRLVPFAALCTLLYATVYVPTKTSTLYLLNISAINQPIFTMFGAHIWWTFLTVSAILLV